MKHLNLTHRPRRNRINHNIREMLAETNISSQQLILPIFVAENITEKAEIKTMPGIYRNTVKSALAEIEKAMSLDVHSFALFPAISEANKDKQASESINESGFLPKLIKEIKKQFPECVLISDLALDPFSADGHDGFVENGKIINDKTVLRLGEMATLHAHCGVDIVAPSDMMDGRVGHIRKALDEKGFIDTAIMAYTAKYASSFYGPFRDALDSAPKAGDKKTYQMDFRNKKEALRETLLDLEEGADFVMVKPALSYLDVIQSVKNISTVPVAAYNVSGEYAMIKAAAAAGMVDETKAMVETLYSIKRAGADVILTYFAIPMANWLKNR
jgi:porphobilinogen synthase